MKRIVNLLITLITFFILICCTNECFSQKYSIDNEKNMKTSRRYFRKTKEDRIAIKKDKAEKKKKKKAERARKKYLKKYNKKVRGGDSEINKKKKVYKRMKKSQREAKKNRR